MKRAILTTTSLLLLTFGLLPPAIAQPTATLYELGTVGDQLKDAREDEARRRDQERQREAQRREQERQREGQQAGQQGWERQREAQERQEQAHREWERQREAQQRNWERQQNSRRWEQRHPAPQRDWVRHQSDWYEFIRRINQTRSDYHPHQAAYLTGTTRVELSSLTNDWVTVLIEGLDGSREMTFTGSNASQVVYLPTGAYRLRFRPTLSSRPWESGYLRVGQTSLLRIWFDQDHNLIQVEQDPTAWIPDRVP